MVQTIPTGCAPGSDAGNLSVMGYDPAVYLTGRSPLEAASIGIDMEDTDVSFRVNVITLTRRGRIRGFNYNRSQLRRNHNSGGG